MRTEPTAHSDLLTILYMMMSIVATLMVYTKYCHSLEHTLRVSLKQWDVNIHIK